MGWSVSPPSLLKNVVVARAGARVHLIVLELGGRQENQNPRSSFAAWKVEVKSNPSTENKTQKTMFLLCIRVL